MKRLILTVLSLAMISCTEQSTGVTDTNGEVILKINENQLDSNGCPTPDSLDIKDKNGNPLRVVRVVVVDGKCFAKVK